MASRGVVVNMAGDEGSYAPGIDLAVVSGVKVW